MLKSGVEQRGLPEIRATLVDVVAHMNADRKLRRLDMMAPIDVCSRCRKSAFSVSLFAGGCVECATCNQTLEGAAGKSCGARQTPATKTGARGSLDVPLLNIQWRKLEHR